MSFNVNTFNSDNWHRDAADEAKRDKIKTRRWGMRVTVYDGGAPGDYVLSYGLNSTNLQDNLNWLKVADIGVTWGGGGGGGVNIYNTDGILTGGRVLDGGGFDLNFIELSGFNLESPGGDGQFQMNSSGGFSFNTIDTFRVEATGTGGGTFNMEFESEVGIRLYAPLLLFHADGSDMELRVDSGDLNLNPIAPGRFLLRGLAATAPANTKFFRGDGVWAVPTPDVTLYNGDGSLSSNRTVSGSGLRSLTFNALTGLTMATQSGSINMTSADDIVLNATDTININPTGNILLKGLVAASPATMFFRGDGTWAVPAGGGGTNIYNSDGVLTGDRVMTGLFNLSFGNFPNVLNNFQVHVQNDIGFTTITGNSTFQFLSTGEVNINAGTILDLNATTYELQGIAAPSPLTMFFRGDGTWAVPPASDIALTAHGIWEYQNLLTTPVPAGKIRFDNNVSPAAITQMNIAQVSDDGQDAGFVFLSLQPGDLVFIQQQNDATRWARFKLSAVGIDNGTWWTFPLTFVASSGILPNTNTKCILRFTEESASGTNIYVADGNLTGNRIVNGATFTLSFTNVSNFVVSSTGDVVLNATDDIDLNPTSEFRLKGLAATLPTTQFFRGDGQWASPGGVPAGPVGAVQFHGTGTLFAGEGQFTYDTSANIMAIINGSNQLRISASNIITYVGGLPQMAFDSDEIITQAGTGLPFTIHPSGTLFLISDAADIRIGTNSGVTGILSAAGSGANADLIIRAKGVGNLIMDTLPIAVAGLPTGALWNNAGVLSVAP